MTETKNTLRDRSFIADMDQGITRICKHCFNGLDLDKNNKVKYSGKCNSPIPRSLFNVEGNLSSKLDKKEVGHYCPYFNNRLNYQQYS